MGGAIALAGANHQVTEKAVLSAEFLLATAGETVNENADTSQKLGCHVAALRTYGWKETHELHVAKLDFKISWPEYM